MSKQFVVTEFEDDSMNSTEHDCLGKNTALGVIEDLIHKLQSGKIDEIMLRWEDRNDNS